MARAFLYGNGCASQRRSRQSQGYGLEQQDLVGQEGEGGGNENQSDQIHWYPHRRNSARAQRVLRACNIRRGWSNPYDLDGAIAQLRIILSLHGVQDCRIDRRQAHDILVRMTSTFDSWESASRAREALEEGRRGAHHDRTPSISRATLFLRQADPNQHKSSIPLAQFTAQRALWAFLSDPVTGGKSCSLQFDVVPNIEKVFVKVGGDDKRLVGALKVQLEKLTSGEKVDGWHPSLAQDSFRHSVAEDTGV